MNSQEEIQKFFNIERKRHNEFFLPFYIEKNWQVIKDNIDGNCKMDWDVKLEIFAGEYVLVDEKAITGEWNDFLVEIMQDMETGSLGWFFSRKDWILYGSWADIENIYPTSLYLVKAKELEDYIYRLDGFIKTCISKKGWGITYNLVLNWDDLIIKGVAEKLI